MKMISKVKLPKPVEKSLSIYAIFVLVIGFFIIALINFSFIVNPISAQTSCCQRCEWVWRNGIQVYQCYGCDGDPCESMKCEYPEATLCKCHDYNGYPNADAGYCDCVAWNEQHIWCNYGMCDPEDDPYCEPPGCPDNTWIDCGTSRECSGGRCPECQIVAERKCACASCSNPTYVYRYCRKPQQTTTSSSSTSSTSSSTTSTTTPQKQPAYNMRKVVVGPTVYDEGDTVTFQVIIENTGDIAIDRMSFTDEYDNRYIRFLDMSGSRVESDGDTIVTAGWDVFQSNLNPSNPNGSFSISDLTNMDTDNDSTLLGDLQPGEQYVITERYTALAVVEYEDDICNYATTYWERVGEKEDRACISIRPKEKPPTDR